MSLARHLSAIGLLPGTVTGAVPVWILAANGTNIGWGMLRAAGALPVLAGAALIAIGVGLMVRTISLFVTVGRGTLAPWDPTSHLVVRGPYRHVRNPMISGVLFILAGESALFGSVPLLLWFGCFFAVNAIYMPLVEEPGLVRRFGDEYLAYRRAVPRWIPRLRPWTPDDAESSI